jgi:hypothetical protein
VSRQPAAFVIVVAFLAGASVFRGWALAISPPSVGTPSATFLWVVVAVTLVCAVGGGIQALSDNQLTQPLLRAFLILYSVSVVSETLLPWQPFELSIGIGFDGFRLGPNIVGLALLGWYGHIRLATDKVVPAAAVIPPPRAGEPAAEADNVP